MTDHDDREAIRRTLDEWAAEGSPVADDVARDVRSGQHFPKAQATPGDFLPLVAGGLPEHVILAGNVYPGAPTAFAVIPPPAGSGDDPTSPVP